MTFSVGAGALLLPLLLMLAPACTPDGGIGPGRSEVLWSVPRPSYGPPLIAGDLVYFVSRDHGVLALGRNSGAVRWERRSDFVGSDQLLNDRPRLAGDLVLYGDDILYAFDALTGDRRWTFRGGEGGHVVGVYDVTSDEERVYTGSITGWAFAADRSTGALLWETMLGSGSLNIVRAVAVSDGVVLMLVRRDGPLFTGAVHALDGETGAMIWTYEIPREGDRLNAPSRWAFEPGAAEGPTLVVSYTDGRVAALDTRTGDPRWILPRSPAQTTRDATRVVSISGGLVLITTTADDTIAAHDLRTGELQWQVAPGQGSIVQPITSDERNLFVVFTNGRLGVFDVATGRGRTILDAPTGVFYAAPAIMAGELYIAGSHGFFALRRP